jgi:hypothetical protein
MRLGQFNLRFNLRTTRFQRVSLKIHFYKVGKTMLNPMPVPLADFIVKGDASAQSVAQDHPGHLPLLQIQTSGQPHREPVTEFL